VVSSPIEGVERVELITDRSALAGLEDDWRRLAEARSNPFITPEWFWAWIRQHEDRAEPALAVVWRPDGSLRGLLPLIRATTGRLRRIRFGGYDLADHLEPVAADGDRVAVAGAAAAALDLAELGCATLVLDNVDAEPPWWEELADGAPGRLVAKRVKGSVLPYADISSLAWEHYLKGRSRNFRRDIRRKLARLERDHTVEFRCTASQDELAADLEALYRLHDARWSDGNSTAAGDRTRAVLSDFAAASLDRGWLRLWTLSLDGAPVAALMQWLVGSRVSSYYTGFDPGLRSEGVGLVLTAHTLRAAIKEGADEFNMLLGDEPWKQRFATDRRAISTVVLVRGRHPARMIVSAEAGARRAIGHLSPRAQQRVNSLARPLARMLPSVRRR
jgi:CelD/BcsL family acetyltransferase involved in cellulose biosynthesis